MGQYANDIIDGLCDSSGDYTYKHNQKNDFKWIHETEAENNIRKVRKELAILIKDKIIEYPNINNNVIVNTCRKYINLKYGKGWRERGIVINDEDKWKSLDNYKEPLFNWDLIFQ